ncbi:MAG: helix-turn-helix domain-containing protein [Clostridia bacterium]|nr:helix-turn-helix domain-containing protein [Clostridia bacterium]
MSTTNMTQREAYRLMLRKYPDVMNVDEVSEVLGVSTKNCYKLIRSGKITSLKVGRAYRIPKAHLFSYLIIGTKK